MKASCPHCNKEIDLVGKKDLEKEPFGLTTNQQQHLRGQGSFPAPWLQLENRYLYLRSHMTDFMEQQDRQKARAVVEDFMKRSENLTERERKARLEIIQEELRKLGAS